MAIIPASAVDYSQIYRRLVSPDPLSLEELEKMTGQVEDPNVPFDKHYKLKEVVNRLHAAVTTCEYRYLNEYLSSNGASEVLDKETKNVVFIAKTNSLQQDLGVPQSESVSREHLFYLLDRGNFAGVPPAFRIYRFPGVAMSFSFYVKNETNKIACSDTLHPSIRKCFIHQFRTMTMDPSSMNHIKPVDREGFIPIDGGYSLPCRTTGIEKEYSIVNRSPLRTMSIHEERFSEEEARYIEEIDLEKDVELLNTHLPKSSTSFQEDVIRIFKAANLVLKQAVALQKSRNSIESTITLHDICEIWMDERHHRGTLFEYICEDAKDVNERIQTVFKEVISVKDYIANNKTRPSNEVLSDLHKWYPKDDRKDTALRVYSSIYLLGWKAYINSFKNP